MKVAGCFGYASVGAWCMMHDASERISGEPKEAKRWINALDSIPTHVTIPHHNVPPRTNGNMTFTRFASCKTFLF